MLGRCRKTQAMSGAPGQCRHGGGALPELQAMAGGQWQQRRKVSVASPAPAAGQGSIRPSGQGLDHPGFRGRLDTTSLRCPLITTRRPPYSSQDFAFQWSRTNGPAQCQAGTCKGFQDAMRKRPRVPGLPDDHVTHLADGKPPAPTSERSYATYFSKRLLTALESTYCINPGRVFAAGEPASGASFTNILGCRFADKLLAVAPVDGYAAPLVWVKTSCKGAVGGQ